MLIKEKNQIGRKLYEIRKKCGLTQFEVAEKASLSDRTYADIERGHVNMRVDTLLKICDVLKISPNDVLVEENLESSENIDELIKEIETFSMKDKQFITETLISFIKTR